MWYLVVKDSTNIKFYKQLSLFINSDEDLLKLKNEKLFAYTLIIH